MPDYTYLIVGGGMTADAAAQALHEADPAGSIGLLSAEPHPPYDRPPLSKALWKGEPEDKIWRKTAATGAALHLGRRITALDPRGRSVTDDRGTVYRYQKLLLATGGVPRRLPLKTDQIIYFRTLDDYRRLRALARQRARFAAWRRACTWSTKTTPTRWGAPSVSTWRAGRRPIITCRFSTPTCSSWATKPWATSTPVSRRSPTGRTSSAKGSSTT